MKELRLSTPEARSGAALQRLLGQGALLFGGQVAVMALNLVTGVILARGLGPDGRGAYAAVLIWPHVLGWVSTLGFNRATAYYRATDPRRERALVANGLLVAVVVGSLAAAGAAAVLPAVLRRHDAAVVGLGRAALLLVPVIAFSDILEWLFKGAGAFGAMAGIRVAFAVLQGGGVAVLFFLGRLEVAGAVLVWALASLAVLLLQGAVLWARAAMSVRPVPGALKQSARYGLLAFPAVLAEIGLQSIDQILLVPMLSSTALGLYVVSSRAMLLFQLPWALSQVLFSSLAERGASRPMTLPVQVVLAGAAITAAVGAGLFVLAEPIILLLYGTAFAPAVGPFRVLLFGAFAMGVARLGGETLAALGRPGRSSATQVVTVGLLGALLGAAVPRFGLLGAAWAVTLAHWGGLLLIIGLLWTAWAAGRRGPAGRGAP